MKTTLIILLAGCLCSCGTEPETPKTKPNVPVNESTLLDAQLDALNKAREVEDLLDETTKKRDQAMRDNGI